MKAFVAGATGETGRRIVAQLVERQIPVRALVRNREKAAEILPAGVEIVVAPREPDRVLIPRNLC